MWYCAHMPNKTFYVSSSDETFWTRGKKRAADQGLSMSEYISRLIRNDVMKIDPPRPVTDSDIANTLDWVSKALRKRGADGAS